MSAQNGGAGSTIWGALGALWGVGGICLMLISALYRLGQKALEAFAMDLGLVHGMVAAGWIAWMAWAEGYRGFHQAFSPRVVARAQHLVRHPRPLLVLAAPVFCFGLIFASRRRLIVSWILALGIIALVLIVRLMPQPWRGIVDSGVVVGLGIGLMSILYFSARALAGKSMPCDPDVPTG